MCKDHVKGGYKDLSSLNISSCREVVKNLSVKQKLYIGSLSFYSKTISPNTPSTCAFGKLSNPPNNAKCKVAVKQAHGWKHTDMKTTEVEVSSHGPILQVKASEKLESSSYILCYLFLHRQNFGFSKLRLRQRKGGLAIMQHLHFPTIRALFRNGKHKQYSWRNHRPEYVKMTMMEMYIKRSQGTTDG